MPAPITSIGINNVMIPKGGPKVVPTNLDFSTVAQIDIDGEPIVSQGKIEFLQGVFIDNADNLDKFTLTMNVTGERIICPPQSQGYFTILQPNPPKMLAGTTQANGKIINLQFYNVPIIPAVWKVT